MNFKLFKAALGLVKRQPAPDKLKRMRDRFAPVGVQPLNPPTQPEAAHREVDGTPSNPTR